MIPTAPLPARNRLAATILAALHDPSARAELAALASGALDPAAWLAAGDAGHAEGLRRRARAAHAALAPRPFGPRGGSLDETLDDAAALFDAGLGFETHELLEARWSGARGDERDALQGLIQVAVGFQHRANGNAAGARSLIAEGAARLRGRTLAGRALEAFARRALEALDAGGAASPPRFPR